jgi:hypothetical protein
MVSVQIEEESDLSFLLEEDTFKFPDQSSLDTESAKIA